MSNSPYSSTTTGRLLRSASRNRSAYAVVVLQSLSMRFFIASGSHSSIFLILCSFYLQC